MNKGGKNSDKHRWIQISNQLEIISYFFSEFIYKSAGRVGRYSYEIGL